jgi:Response regulator containing a CheY-like receiver domain and an HTH DNA-binding domain
MVKLIITDDHRMFRESIRKILITEKIADVVDEAENGVDLMELLKIRKPDMVLMDIAMPEMDGVEATKQALKLRPELKVIVLSSFGDEKYYFSMVEAGVKGFVLKNSGIAELKNAIEEVYHGRSWFSPELLQKIILRLNAPQKKNKETDLSDRELEVLRLICQSLTNEEIADKLSLSYETIKWHRANILSKTGCSNTAGLVIYAIKNKLIEI